MKSSGILVSAVLILYQGRHLWIQKVQTLFPLYLLIRGSVCELQKKWTGSVGIERGQMLSASPLWLTHPAVSLQLKGPLVWSQQQTLSLRTIKRSFVLVKKP
ncbi:hypothetical protein UPYG_G00073750 [Umbra pygmaea]|uniref:Uncharacterized protein n=1 Tax=Umbra pygmaea TaxID=75934 RepID=A0ABD0XC95_UMBPY